MAIIGFVTARPILVLLDTDPVILNDAVAYLKVVSIGIVCVGFIMACQVYLEHWEIQRHL